MNKFLITGTGRCGTTYCAEILKSCGINCGHQSVFRHETLYNYDFGDYEGDSSYEAIPILHKLKNITIIHIHRDKELVINSYLRSGVFDPENKHLYYRLINAINSVDKNIFNEKEIVTAHNFYDAWYKVAEKYADYTFDITELNPLELFKAIGREEKYNIDNIKTISKQTNKHYYETVFGVFYG